MAMKLTEDEKIAHANAWRTDRETTDSLKASRGKVYSLLLSQCTQVLVVKMKQDADWVIISESFDPILLFNLIETRESVGCRWANKMRVMARMAIPAHPSVSREAI